MDDSVRRLNELEAGLEAAKARHRSAAPLYSGITTRGNEQGTAISRDVLGAWVLGGAALVIALWGAIQANHTANRALETAQRSTIPRLEFVVDAEKQTLSLQNDGNAPAVIYYAKLTHRDWTIEQSGRAPSPSDLQSFFPVVLSNLYDDTTFSPKTTTSGVTGIVADKASLPLLSIDTPMTKAQRDKLSELSRQVKIELCYTSMQADAAFWASFGTDETTLQCPRPPHEDRVATE